MPELPGKGAGRLHHVLIVNPTAGTGYALQVLEKLERMLREEFHAEYRVLRTDKPGHAKKLAAEAARDPEIAAVFSVGGDGTASEVAAGLAGTGVPLGIIPAGTGNDFIKCIGVPKDPEEAFRLAMTHPAKDTDLGRLNDGCFLNISGTGFDVTVLDYAEKLKSRYRGLTPYLLGLLKAIAHYRAVRLKITIDGKTEEGKYLICSVANGQFFGGGIPICPAANPADGKLDVVLVRDVPRWKIPFYLPGLMMGKVLRFRIARHLTAESVIIEGAHLRVNADGEIFPMDRAEFSVLKGALRLFRT